MEHQTEGTYRIARGSDDNGSTLIYRILNVPTSLDRSRYPQMVEIAWPYSPNDKGFPDEKTTIAMDDLEDALSPALEKDTVSLWTVTITGNGKRFWLWYTSDFDKFIGSLNDALSGKDPFPIEISTFDDPEWENYGQF